MKDVAKVMREVGYNTKDPARRSSIADQIAEAEARPKKTMDDAINAAMAKIAPSRESRASIVLPKSTPTVKEAEKIVKDLKSPVPSVAVKAAEKVLTNVEPVLGEMKTILVDMSELRTEVTFTETGWCIRDIKIAYMELVRAFNIKIRGEYRKGIK